MEAILTIALAVALGAALLLVFVVLPLAVLGLCGVQAIKLMGASAAYWRALREYWAVAAQRPMR